MRLISPRSYTGRWIVVPESRERLARQAVIRAQQQRKRVLTGLIALAVATGIWAVLVGGSIVELHLVMDAAVAFYVALLLDARRRRFERVSKVHDLSGRRAAPAFETDHALDVAGVGGGTRP